MKHDSEARWALGVRVLALSTMVVTTVAVLEGRAIRSLRAELQTLRVEREQVKERIDSTWAQQSQAEVGVALKWLDAFMAEPSEGLGRPGGLCPNGKFDADTIGRFAVAVFLSARATGLSVPASIAAMRTAIVGTDAYRLVHPPRTPPSSEK